MDEQETLSSNASEVSQGTSGAESTDIKGTTDTAHEPQDKTPDDEPSEAMEASKNNGSKEDDFSLKSSVSDIESLEQSAGLENLENHVTSEVNSVDGSVTEHSDLVTENLDNEKSTEDSTEIDGQSTEVDSNKEPIQEDKDESQECADTQETDESTIKDEEGDLDKETDNSQTEHNDERKDDDIENPQFENAPNVPTEDSQDDHSQALDPFDALLKDTATETASGTANTSQSDANINTNLDDDDDDHAVSITEGDADLDDRAADDTAPEENESTELTDEPGADEEVCLLPDTEREISDADKAKAAQALADKRKQAEAELAALEVPKSENDLDVDESVDKDSQEVNDTTENVEAVAEDTHTDAEADKEKGNESEASGAEDAPTSNNIQEISSVDARCTQCLVEKSCKYRFQVDDIMKYLCNDDCLKYFREAHPGQYTIATKKYIIEELEPNILTCSECEESKMCYFYYNYDGEDTNYCSLKCLESMMADEKDKYIFKRRKLYIHETDPKEDLCFQCHSIKICNHRFVRYGVDHKICDIPCIKALNDSENNRYIYKRRRSYKRNVPVNPPLLKLKVISNATDKYLDEGYKVQQKTPAMIQAARDYRERSFIRRCNQCNDVITHNEKNLNWETMDFCGEPCLSRYQYKIGSKCANCRNSVMHTSLGKYCVRFGYDIRQFCNSGCLEEFKKGLKICCYCQRDMSTIHEGFLAPVGDKGQFKDFCSQNCMEKFDNMSKNPVPQPVWSKCAVCTLEKPSSIEVEVAEERSQRLCSEPCFAAYKFVNSIVPDQCKWCKKYFERTATKCFTIYDEPSPFCFCSQSCMNVYISNSRHIVPCNWCKVKKYNFDMIRRSLSNGQDIMMCSLNCLSLYQVSVNAVTATRIKCDMCKRTSLAQYHLTMSDATVRNFCTYQCVMSFQGQYTKHPPLMPGESAVEQPKAVPTGAPRRTYASTPHKNNSIQKPQARTTLPVISNVQSLASAPPPPPAAAMPALTTRAKSKRKQLLQPPPPPEPEPPQREPTPPPPPKPPTPPPPPPPKIYNHVLVKTLPPSEVANKATMSKPMMVSKGVSCRPHPCTKECQTDPSLERRVLIPVPVPIYVPVPCAMYSLPFPVPVPIPIPIPTPVFIPTTRNSAKGIMKEISKIHDKMPTDPFEAELLMMAEMVAGDKKKDQSDSDTDEDNAAEEGFSPVAMDGGNAFGEDMLQMALKMASDYEEAAVDLESAMTANTITPSSHPGMPGLEGEGMHHHQMMVLEQQRAVAALRASSAPRKRAPVAPPAAAPARPTRASKRRRAEPAPQPQPEPPREPAEKPDANMCLKYTFGVNAWKQWVMTKNAEIENSSVRRKPFKSEILQLTADELNYSLCLFVKEVRKPNGSEYAPDTIYYLVLGIQQYLFENGRIDNIFTDPYYEKFTDCLDEVARKFSVLYNDSQYIVTRVEEEHLWESKQLGAHSPHVLLSTLMFFNTKHFNLVTVEEHMQLSFSHIMKHWKRNPNQPGQAKIPGSRNVLLRFYPPQSALEANSRKKKVYEQQENEENPLRCPVKLYEFYISKCPESVRTRNDVFYLQPERSCVPDSPVWYSTQPLSRDALAKMLHRVKMVKEINIALLTS